MGDSKRFEDLVCWQLASELSDLVDDMTGAGPAARDFDLKDQIRRSATKAPAQIAEAFGRRSPADTANMLRIARASLLETQSHLLKGNRRKHWTGEPFDKAWSLSDRTIRTTTGYLNERRRTAQREKQRPATRSNASKPQP
jgi:four helix bundle protein